MREFLQKERVQWIAMLTLLMALIIALIFFFEWLRLPYSTAWRLILYSTLVMLCIPLFIETSIHRRVKSEHEKIMNDLKRIEQDLHDYRNRPGIPAVIPVPPVAQAPAAAAKKPAKKPGKKSRSSNKKKASRGRKKIKKK
ncbi:hypothetical protein JXB28_01570 [Candidatus Woesearchaeota archaeon]|nr:hypothetical protein [Candidatus Woesearchaeota archaeon]